MMHPRKLLLSLTILLLLWSILPITLAQLTLTITVPSSSKVIVDGINPGYGAVIIHLAEGKHTVTVSQYIPLNNQSRLRFDHWSDGSSQFNRTIYLTTNTSLTAVYVQQFRLKIISYFSYSGAGWYDDGSKVNFATVTSPQPMNNTSGPFGGRWVFAGWYDNGTVVTTSNSGSITMNRPHTLTALWYADYTTSQLSQEIMAVASVGAVSVIAGTLIYTSKRSGKKRDPRNLPRKTTK